MRWLFFENINNLHNSWLVSTNDGLQTSSIANNAKPALLPIVLSSILDSFFYMPIAQSWTVLWSFLSWEKLHFAVFSFANKLVCACLRQRFSQGDCCFVCDRCTCSCRPTSTVRFLIPCSCAYLDSLRLVKILLSGLNQALKKGSGYRYTCGSWNKQNLLLIRHLWRNSYAQRECSRLGRNKVNVKDKP